MENRNETRLNAYKNQGKNSDELRSRRVEISVNLRKAQKDDQMFKRRNINEDELPLQNSNGQSPILLTLDDIIKGMDSNDSVENFEAVRSARKMLSRERNPPIDIMINHGIVPKCVMFLEANNPDLQFEAAWALTNIASGTSEQTMSVVEAGAVDKFIHLLSSTSAIVAEQSVWALGNISGDSSKTRDIVLNANVIEGLLNLFNRDVSIALLRNITWLISNLCRNKNPPAPFDKVQIVLPVLANLLVHEDTQVVTDAAWAISYVTDDENHKIQAVIDSECVPPLVKLLEKTEASIIIPALRSIGNIVTGNDTQTDVVIAAGALKPLTKLLQSRKASIVKEAAWTISNITAGTAAQIQHVIDAGLLPLIQSVLEKGDVKSQKEAAWIVTNTTTSGNPQQVALIITQGILTPFCKLMESNDARTVKVILIGISNLLEFADRHFGREYICTLIEEIGALEMLENLQNHDNEEIYNKALSIIESYFSDDEEQNLVPEENNGALNFGSNNAQQNRFNF